MINQKKMYKGKIREFLDTIIFAVIASIIIRIFVVEAYAIPSGSMKDTFMIGDKLLANKFIYGVRTPDRIPLIDLKIPNVKLPGLRDPKQGDIVIFKYPKDNKTNYVKRCIALPGQKVEIKNGDVYIDDKIEGQKKFIKREYDPGEGQYCLYYEITMNDGTKYIIRHYDNKYTMYQNWGPVTVPDNHYFMMGDNRDNSLDSRSWGYVPYENILGKPMIIFWSWNPDLPFYKFFNKIRWNRIVMIVS